MRTRLTHRSLARHFKKILVLLFLALAIPAAAALLLWSLPTLTGYVARAGLISAGFALPEGGLAYLGGYGSESVAPVVSESSESSQIAPPEDVDSAVTSDSGTSQGAESSEEATSSLPAEDAPPPVIPEENKATLVYKTFSAAPSPLYIPLKNGYIKNCTKLPRADVEAAVQNPPAFSLTGTTEPQVLIMHTHATESYMPYSGDVYDKTLSFRSTDNRKNMVVVGNRIAAELEAAGIGVLHDVTQHDYPSYNGAYERSRVTISNYLKKYPSIQVVLDIHRDAIASGSTVTAPVCEVNGKTAAQVMIISGCDDGTMKYPDYLKNLSFAAALQNQMEGDFPGFTRPVLFDYRFYNQNLTPGTLLIEVGGHGNTLEQAAYSGACIGKSLGTLLNGLK